MMMTVNTSLNCVCASMCKHVHPFLGASHGCIAGTSQFARACALGYGHSGIRLGLKCDGTRTETRFRLSAKRAGPFKSAEASVQSTTGSRGVRINGSNAGYTMFRGSVKGTGYPLLSSVSPSLPLPCVTVCHHISTGLYHTAKSRSSTSQKTGYANVFRGFPVPQLKHVALNIILPIS
jgi:hypothetical protein